MYGQANILVIDDDEAMRDSCKQALSRDGNRVEVAKDGLIGLDMLKKEAFDLVILDLKMPGLDGMDVLNAIKKDDPESIVIVITGYATIESAVEAMKRGAYDFVPKPFEPDSLRMIVKRALEKRKLALENVLLKDELMEHLGSKAIIGQSKSMKKVEDLVLKVSPTDSTVLILGESGTGKELIARAIHYHSSRKDKPFVVVDCGSLVENLFESELFGHIKGSFTGATETKYGRFELANGGTLFFDEIGNIGMNIQTKLLRVLQEREIMKVGSSQVIKVDVRLIAATNKDLQKEVKDGIFREDLFYRLSVVPIALPPLRERREDIPLLANEFLKIYNNKRKKNIRAITNRAMNALVEYDWPGNVRELENAIERAVVLSEGDLIEPEDLFYYGLAVDSTSKTKTGETLLLIDVEREHIIKTFKRFNGQISRAAEALGIDRKTLRFKLKKYGISQDSMG
ncbi:MAG: sigma-54-dependent Fis family transcriptional regulator [Spirochaetota bacterium]|nr:MAG: sigma-54-dependent Fis family transcriptional regulator [Spirochaetota bacterium]